MTNDRTIIVERCRSAITGIQRVKDRLEDGFERLVIRNLSIEAYDVIRKGSLEEIKAMTLRLNQQADQYRISETTHA